MDKKTLGSFLSALRRARGLTQQEVADRLAVSNRAVSRWERDEAMPDIALLPAIADLFEVTVDELLRGERKRTADPIDTAAEPASAPPSEQPARPEPDPRALRGLRAMMNRALSRFRTLMILALALPAAGLFLMLGVSYGFYRPTIGVVLLLLFVVGSITVAGIAALRMKEPLDESASEESETRLPAAEFAPLCRTYAEWIFRAGALNGVAVLLGLPLILFRDEYLPESVLSSESYIPMVLVILLISLLLLPLLHAPIIRSLCRRWMHVVEDGWGKSTRDERNPLSLKLTLWQLLPAWFITIGVQVANGLVVPKDSTEIDYFSIIASAFLLIGVAISCISFPLALRGRKTDPPLRRNLVVSGIRNLAVCAVGICTIASCVSYGWIKDDPNHPWEAYQYWNEGAIVLGIIAILVIFLAAELIRRYLQNRKP